MDKKERLSALEVALNNEQNEREFYLKNAKRTKNELGKKMFLQIADEELEHYELLKKLHEIWQKQEKWPETVPLMVNDTNVKEILKTQLVQIDKNPAKDNDDLEALKIACEFEDKGSSFYAKMRDSVEDKQEKEFFGLLAKIEREHFLSLKDVQEYLEDPSSWFIRNERHGMDGA